MVFAVGLLITLSILLLILRLLKLNIKIIFVVIFLVAFVLSAVICVCKPTMHKQFSIDIVDYFVKINDDGTMSTIKQTTKTIIKKENKDLEK